mmetsp:Transcript_16121/g.46267  ORF Transcript_16121/g.46267 Transcript_16121/m.46267 type:complete len:504 (+) Transcript_16121:66-1577(+)
MFRRHQRGKSQSSSISSFDDGAFDDEELHQKTPPAPQAIEVSIGDSQRATPASSKGRKTIGTGTTSYLARERNLNPEGGGWDCLPYKQYIIRQEVERANGDQSKPPYAGIVNELKNLGVRVYIVSYSSDDVLSDVRHIVSMVSKDDRRAPLREKQRCLLYRDERDRVFNLKVKGESSGLAGQWEAQLLSFSGFEAIVALTVLCRAFPCINMDGENGVRPGYLTILIGLVLSEEIGFVLVNVSMLIRGMPSVSAYALNHKVLQDWPRKAVVFLLILASAAPANSATQRWITLAGVVSTISVLAANLGSRAWVHLKINPLAYAGPGAVLLAFLAATFTGLVVPFIGHREVRAGGKAAMEVVLRSAFLSAACFILSDIDAVQQFVIVGSEMCSQDVVNISISVWFFATLIACTFFVARIKTYRPTPEETEPILVEDHASPVGYVVPNLPDVNIDPSLGVKGAPCCSLKVYYVVAILLGLAILATLCFMAFSDADDSITTQFFDFLP